jgi:hypothetical protein
VKALTPNSDDPDIQQAPMTQEAREEALLAPSKEYLFLLDSIRTRVRRQIMALEEAGIISVDSASRTGPDTLPIQALATSPPAGERKGIKESGHLGSLDVSWLNARNNRIGDKKAADLRAEAEALLQRVGVEADVPATAHGNEEMDTS